MPTNTQTSTNWFYLNGTNKVRPVNEMTMADLIHRGVINQDTMVWTEGFINWQRADTTSLRQYAQRVVPSVSTNVVSDKWLWALATVPIFVSFFLTFAMP